MLGSSSTGQSSRLISGRLAVQVCPTLPIQGEIMDNQYKQQLADFLVNNGQNLINNATETLPEVFNQAIKYYVIDTAMNLVIFLTFTIFFLLVGKRSMKRYKKTDEDVYAFGLGVGYLLSGMFAISTIFCLISLIQIWQAPLFYVIKKFTE